MAGETVNKIVNRYDRLAFMEVTDGGSKVYKRLSNFTDFTSNKNPAEYSRRYVDKKSNDNDVTGYDPSVSYAFDRMSADPCHKVLADIHDNEKTCDDALVNIVVVDLFDETSTTGTYVARKRTYAVIPGADGSGTDALVYSGTLKSKSDIEIGTATLDTTKTTATYTAPTS